MRWYNHGVTPTDKFCDICNGVLSPSNTTNFCSRTLACRQARDKIRDRKDYRKEHYYNNKEYYSTKHASYYSQNKEVLSAKFKRWDDQNRDKRIARQQRRRSRIADVVWGDISVDVLWNFQKGICSICNSEMLRNEVSLDHWIPISKDGGTVYGNVWLAHKSCNSRKKDKMPEYFPEFLEQGLLCLE